MSIDKKRSDRIPLYRISAFGPTVKSMEFDYDRLERRLAPLPYPHRHDFYQLLWISKGGGPHVIDSVDYPVRTDSVYFLSPGQVHSLSLPQDACGYVMNFSAEFYQLALQDKSALKSLSFFAIDNPKPCLYLSAEQASALRQVIEHIEDEYYGEQPGYQDLIRSYLQIFLMLCKRFSASQDERRVAPRDYELTRRFRMLVEERFLTRASLADYAALLHVTERHLSDATKKTTGMTASEIIHARVMLEAKRYLAHSPLSIAEIATRLNFEDPAYFTRFFKKNTGCPPGEYKKQQTTNRAWL